MFNSQITNKIIESLVPLGVDKVILFGSFSKGVEKKDSDINLFDDCLLAEVPELPGCMADGKFSISPAFFMPH